MALFNSDISLQNFWKLILWRGCDLTRRVKSFSKAKWVVPVAVVAAEDNNNNNNNIARELEAYIDNVLMVSEKTGQRRRQLSRQSTAFLTLDTVRGMLKSFPPCSLKPQGDGPLRVTEYTFIALAERKGKKKEPYLVWKHGKTWGYTVSGLYPTMTWHGGTDSVDGLRTCTDELLLTWIRWNQGLLCQESPLDSHIHTVRTQQFRIFCSTTPEYAVCAEPRHQTPGELFTYPNKLMRHWRYQPGTSYTILCINFNRLTHLVRYLDVQFRV